MIPKDPFILLSFVNTKLRDMYPSLKDLCEEEGCDIDYIISSLDSIGYVYSNELNAFKEN